MSSDPRLTALMTIRRNNPHWSAVQVLAALDAEDPLRQPPGDEAVRAFLKAYDGTLGHRGQKAMGGFIAALAVMRGETTDETVPIDMILHCPSCHHQHIDAPEADWTNPPHKSHLCAKCATIWRPCDLPTNGVTTIETRGKFDTWETPDRALGHTDLMVSPEAIDAFVDANPPPDAIEDRIAALEARPQWTAEKERLLRALVGNVWEDMAHEPCAARLVEFMSAAFDGPPPEPQSERVWPPADCRAQEVCGRNLRCDADDFVCPHAGERA